MTIKPKYELTGVSKTNLHGIEVHQIRATEDIPRWNVKNGDIGGWVGSLLTDRGNARVSGDAWVSGNAQVEKPWHLLLVGPIGSENVTATLYRTKNGKHSLVVGCWSGTLGTLMAGVKRRRNGWSADELTQAVWTAQYKALKAMGKATVARWEGDAK